LRNNALNRVLIVCKAWLTRTGIWSFMANRHRVKIRLMICCVIVRDGWMVSFIQRGSTTSFSALLYPHWKQSLFTAYADTTINKGTIDLEKKQFIPETFVSLRNIFTLLIFVNVKHKNVSMREWKKSTKMNVISLSSAVVCTQPPAMTNCWRQIRFRNAGVSKFSLYLYGVNCHLIVSNDVCQ
jgi:hypothetical protein